jgi:hypothetical protein
MARVRSNLLAIIGAFLLVLGLLAPAMAEPCAAGPGASCSMASCDLCLPGALPEAAGCAAAISAVPALVAVGVGRTLIAAAACFHDEAARLDGMGLRPDAPPPR